MHKRRKMPFALLIAAVLVVVGATGAYAFWTTGGGGTGSAATGTSANIVVVQTSTVTAMGPGVDAQDLAGNFTNAGAGPVYVRTVTVVVTDTNHPGCTAADYTIAGSPMTVNQEIPKGTTQGAWGGATIAFNNTDQNQDACKSATVNLTYTVG